MYVTVCVPKLGSNEFPETPIPEKAPPAGVPTKETLGALTHTEL